MLASENPLLLGSSGHTELAEGTLVGSVVGCQPQTFSCSASSATCSRLSLPSPPALSCSAALPRSCSRHPNLPSSHVSSGTSRVRPRLCAAARGSEQRCADTSHANYRRLLDSRSALS